MKRISQSRKNLAKRRRERYADSRGLPFDEYRLWLPERVSEWPRVKPVMDYEPLSLMHGLFDDECWNCGSEAGWGHNTEAHHIFGAARRSDELTNLAMLCRRCHENVNTPALPLGRILYLKWKADRWHLDWVRLATIAGKHLPDLITE